LEIKVARIFNTYGPRMHPNDGRVVSNFIMQALANKPITLFGDGEQTRSFCFVDDMVDGLIRLMASPSDVTGPVNLGNPAEFTMRELAEQIVAASGSQSSFTHLPLPEDDPRQRRPDIRLAWELLEWEPRVDLTAGLDATIRYFRERTRPAA
jgi:UDP-glucuronate decarboxylase